MFIYKAHCDIDLYTFDVYILVCIDILLNNIVVKHFIHSSTF